MEKPTNWRHITGRTLELWTALARLTSAVDTGEVAQVDSALECARKVEADFRSFVTAKAEADSDPSPSYLHIQVGRIIGGETYKGSSAESETNSTPCAICSHEVRPSRDKHIRMPFLVTDYDECFFALVHESCFFDKPLPEIMPTIMSLYIGLRDMEQDDAGKALAWEREKAWVKVHDSHAYEGEL